MKQKLLIHNIPAILWGAQSEKIVIAIHGNMSHKEDIPIEIFARQAVKRGYQVMSFDLPEHGDRKNENTPCKVQYCISDLEVIWEYIKSRWQHISLFANSFGAYFSLLAYKNEAIERAWFLSPVVDMQLIIEKMMMWSGVSEEMLEQEKRIDTLSGQTLYWDYYSYVKENPVNRWNIPTNILYGDKDTLCEEDSITKFTDRFSCKLSIVHDAEHFFHTKEQLDAFEKWVIDTFDDTIDTL